MPSLAVAEGAELFNFMRKRLYDFFYSFPIQLLILHIRSNHLLLGLWLFVTLLIAGAVGKKLGLQYLFLDPEYLGAVNFWSFFFVGFAFGGFLITWNLTTYLLSSQYFPFLASLARPFTKFCINNSILPAAFLSYYISALIFFQQNYQLRSGAEIFTNLLGLFFGALLLILLNLAYFYFTNKDIFSYQLHPDATKRIAPGRRRIDLEYIKMDENRWRVRTYLNEMLLPRMVRSVAHYDSRLLHNIFRQNHLNALVIQLFSMVLLMALGQLMDFAVFRIPAAASIFILGSVIVAIIGALIYWFDHWWLTIFIAIVIIINFATSFEILQFQNKGYGLNYNTTFAEYSYKKLESLCLSDQVEWDKKATEAILNNWLRKNQTPVVAKPKMVVLCVSGGGLRSAAWAMKVVQTADSLTGGGLLNQTVLITGASGGLIGMSYMRALLLQKNQNEQVDLYAPEHIENISKDLLNSVAFAIVSNDLFLPWAKFESGGYTYRKDRGYIFEKQLNENTGGILNQSLAAYRMPEQQALVPMLYVTPAIVNDARRLIISPQGVSFMMIAPVGTEKTNAVEPDAVDFGWMFGQQDADNLRFLSALRMNATYPYVLPNVRLPSRPQVEVMDAGFRDNYGIHSATRFIQVFKDWILEHTSGVVLVQITSSEKIEQIPHSEKQGIIESLINPLGIVTQIMTLQEFEHDNSLGFIYDLLGKGRFEVIRFLYHPNQKNKMAASISFHLTKGEKENVLNAIYLGDNQRSMNELIEALK